MNAFEYESQILRLLAFSPLVNICIKCLWKKEFFESQLIKNKSSDVNKKQYSYARVITGLKQRVVSW